MGPNPGWYQDPYGNPNILRYWDGNQWTSNTQPNQQAPTPQQNYQQPTNPYAAQYNPQASGPMYGAQPNNPYGYQQPQQAPTVQNVYINQQTQGGNYELKQSDRTLRLIAFILDLLGIVSLVMMALMTLFGGVAMLPFVSSSYYATGMMLATGLMAPIFLIPLAWFIPMTVHTYALYKGKKANTVAFGVCSLLFLGLVPGILLLCSTKEG